MEIAWNFLLERERERKRKNAWIKINLILKTLKIYRYFSIVKIKKKSESSINGVI